MGQLHIASCVAAAASSILSYILGFFYGMISSKVARGLEIPHSDLEAYNRVLDRIDYAMLPHLWMYDLSMLLGIICLGAAIVAALTLRLKPRGYCMNCGAKIEE